MRSDSVSSLGTAGSDPGTRRTSAVSGAVSAFVPGSSAVGRGGGGRPGANGLFIRTALAALMSPIGAGDGRPPLSAHHRQPEGRPGARAARSAGRHRAASTRSAASRPPPDGNTPARGTTSTQTRTECWTARPLAVYCRQHISEYRPQTGRGAGDRSSLPTPTEITSARRLLESPG